MKTWLTCLLLFLPALAAAASPGLTEPPELEPDIRFWMRVYSEISTNEGFIHDQHDLSVVYQTLHFDPAQPPRERERLVNTAREHYQAILRRLILDGRLQATEAAEISSSGRESQVLQRLIEQGAIDQATVSESMQRQTEDELQSLFTWDYADFVFHDVGPEQDDINQLLVALAREGLRLHLGTAIRKALTEKADITLKNLRVRTDGDDQVGRDHPWLWNDWHDDHPQQRRQDDRRTVRRPLLL